MSLDFINAITINEKTVTFTELKIKHLKIILKSLLGDSPLPKIVFNNLNHILKNITCLTEEKITKLNFINYFLLLVELRTLSIGDTIFIQHQKNNTKIEFNLAQIKEQLIKLLKETQQEKHIDPNINIFFDLPNIDEILYINEQQNISQFYPCFVRKIIINNTAIDFEYLSLEDKNKIFDQLPAKITSEIIKQSLKYIEHINKTNLISYSSYLKDTALPFNFNIQNLIIFSKFLFGDGLMSLYENIFILCKLGKFSPEYIENCTPGEYILFLKKLEQINSQNKQTKQPIDSGFDDDLDPSDLNPYNSDLPPINSQVNFADLQP